MADIFHLSSPLSPLPSADQSTTQKPIMSSPIFGSESSYSGNPESNIFGAFGTLLGYIGAEAATTASFESLLWPQRSLSNFSLSRVPALVLLTPLGGPMHKIALKVFDIVYRYGLLKGKDQGHMLGTAFFPELGWTYTMHGQGVHEEHTEPLRNCIWARALSLLPMPTMNTASSKAGCIEAASTVRAKVRVSHLVIAKATDKDKQSDLPFVAEQHNTPGLRIFLAIFVSELSAIIMAIGVGVVFRSSWALIWVTPLLLRFISAVAALHREPLMPLTSSTSANDPACDFQVHCPQSEGNFLLMSGPPTLILQFVRHYGHPKRDRCKEVVQLVIIVLFACLFPFQLVCSTIWMPLSMQYVWLCYQLCIVLGMHIARYSTLSSGSETSAAIASTLSKETFGSYPGMGQSEHALLFGHTRHGAETIKVSVISTYHNRFKEGKECLENLLARNRSMSQETLVEEKPPQGLDNSGR